MNSYSGLGRAELPEPNIADRGIDYSTTQDADGYIEGVSVEGS